MINYLADILFITGFSFIILFFYTLFRQKSRLAELFSIMCLAVAVYVIGYGLELRSDNIDQIKFFLKMEYFGLPFIPVFWFVFAYKYFFNRNPSLRLNIAILIIPILTLFFSATNDYHHLFYTNVSAVDYDKFMIARITRGPWYFVNFFYSYIILFLGCYVFYRSWRASQFKIKTQAFWMLLAPIWPGLFNLVYTFGLSPLGLDMMPFGLSISAIFYFIAILRFDNLEFKEIIRGFAFSEISEGILVIDDKNRLIDFNSAGQKIFDWLNPQNIGTDITAFAEGRKIKENEGKTFEIELIKDRMQKSYEFRVTVLKETQKIVGFIYIFQDITKQKEVLEELNHMASHDPLTQIYNRGRLMEEAERELARVKRYGGSISFLMIDIDHFKKVNDRYGHLAGDEVLKAVVKACNDMIRITDIAGRYGGEEFLIILSEANQENVLDVAERIRRVIADLEVNFNGEKIRVTVSIGVATATNPDQKITVQQIINNADIALYNAKNNGRNQISSYVW